MLKKEKWTGKLIVVMEGVYSMDGDIGDLPAARALTDEFKGILILDEAHALGTIGKTGRGCEEHFDYKHKADIICGSLTKSLGSLGGFIVCSEKLRIFYAFHAHGAVFSAPLSAFNTAAGLKALEILERNPEMVTRLQDNAEYFRD
jgi:7-keto-8-aminopelargonate synthetase-like enzyme